MERNERGWRGGWLFTVYRLVVHLPVVVHYSVLLNLYRVWVDILMMMMMTIMAMIGCWRSGDVGVWKWRQRVRYRWGLRRRKVWKFVVWNISFTKQPTGRMNKTRALKVTIYCLYKGIHDVSIWLEMYDLEWPLSEIQSFLWQTFAKLLYHVSDAITTSLKVSNETNK